MGKRGPLVGRHIRFACAHRIALGRETYGRHGNIVAPGLGRSGASAAF